MAINQTKWPVGLGAVFYDERECREDSRSLWHVTSRWEDVDSSKGRMVELWDGTHTCRKYCSVIALFEDYAPAGYTWPVGEKPLYHLTRRCGVEDKGDLMTYGR